MKLNVCTTSISLSLQEVSESRGSTLITARRTKESTAEMNRTIKNELLNKRAIQFSKQEVFCIFLLELDTDSSRARETDNNPSERAGCTTLAAVSISCAFAVQFSFPSLLSYPFACRSYDQWDDFENASHDDLQHRNDGKV